MKTKKRIDLLFALIILTCVSLAAQGEKQESVNQEVRGTIKEVSINVRRIMIEVPEHQEKTVSVETGTTILVNHREGKIEELKPGQAIRVVLPKNSSKAILIEVI